MGDWTDEDEVSESLEVSISFSVTVNTKNPLYTQTNKQILMRIKRNHVEIFF